MGGENILETQVKEEMKIAKENDDEKEREITLMQNK